MLSGFQKWSKSRSGRAVAQVAEARHVADRGIQPDIEIFARRVGNLEAEVGRIAADVPFLQAGIQPFRQLVGHLGLQGAAAGPFAQELLELRQAEEIVLRGFFHGRGAGNGRTRVDQFGRGIGGAADFAVVAVLVFGFAARTGALDEAVGQEHVFFRVVGLGDAAGGDMPVLLQLLIDIVGELAVLVRVGRVVVVEIDQEPGKVRLVFLADPVDQRFRGNAFPLRAQHDGGAVGIIGADIDAVVAPCLLIAHPDVGLDVFQQVAQVNGAVGVGQGTGHQDVAWRCGLRHDWIRLSFIEAWELRVGLRNL